MPLLDGHIPVQGLDPEGGVTRNYRVINNPGIRRPYFNKWGRPAVTINTGRWTVERGQRVPIRESRQIIDLLNQGVIDPVFLQANATAMRKDQWIEMDRVVLLAYRQRLKAWEDLRRANTFGGFNAMARLTLEYEAMSDPGNAVVDMDALTDGRTDSPLFKLRSLPLPITHSDFWFSERRLEVSGNQGTPFDSTMAEACARRIGEQVEKTTIGVSSGMTYGTQASTFQPHDGTSTVYGYTNYPNRTTKTDFTAPTAGGWVANTLHDEVLAALELLYAKGLYGPFTMYYSVDWSKYMNRVFSLSGGNNASETTISMLKKIPDLTDVRRLDFLTDTFTILLVQMTSDVARAINGMEITTVQWPSQGGMRLNFKVMTIQVPQIRSDYTGACGVLHGTTS